MPLQRRLPKRGFHSKFKVEFSIVSLSQLNQLEGITDITGEVLLQAGLVKKDQPVKVLANGTINRPINVKVDKISKGAKSKIESAGGKVLIITV